MQFDDFLKIIDLLQNPTNYKAQIDELKDRQKAIEDALSNLAIGSDISKAKIQADNLNAQAVDAVAQATAQAAQIIAGAQTAFDAKFAELQVREVAADQAIADYNQIKSQQTARENDLRSAEKDLEKARVQLNADQSDLRDKQAEVDIRLSKLREAMG